MSVALHAVLIYAAVHATARGSDPTREGPRESPLPFILDPDRRDEPPVPSLPPLEGLAPLFPPLEIPTTIPPIDSQQVWDPSLYSGIGAGPDTTVSGNGGANPAEVLAEAAVGERPERSWTPPLDYPDLLRQAGIEGTVTVEVIIDTLGRAEPGSLRVVQSTNRAFEPSARDLVLNSHYRPGRVRDQAVRVLVQIPVSFSIRR